jgi:hypothetical protein
MSLRSLAAGLLAFATAAGCTCNPATTLRSGTADEPYLEEPLAGEVADKQPFLTTSNRVVTALASGDLDAAYERMDRTRIQREKFDGMVRSIVAAHGRIVTFLPGQWWFIDDGRQLLSVKLVVFERGCGAVRLIFDRDDPTRARDMWLGDNSCSPNAREAREELSTSP